MSDSKAVIKSVDMSEEMQQEAIEVSTQALEKFNIEKDIAAHIKREFDKKYGPTWHCVVGRNFGSFVTHASIQAILQVMTIVTIGFIFAKTGYFNMDKQKWLSKLNLMYFTPCLLFSNVASIISFEKLIAFWPIPVFYYTYSLLFYLVTQLSTRMLGLNPGYRRFVLACVMFQNTNSLPLATISSLAVSEAAKILFWNSDDTPESVAARGISYTLFFAIFGNLLRWSYGYQLLQKREGDDDGDKENDEEHQQHPYDSYLTIPSSHGYTNPSSSSSSISSITNNTRLQAPTMPDRSHSSLTLAVSPKDEDQDPFKKHVDETTSLLHTNKNNNKKKYNFLASLKRLGLWFHGCMTPPLYAAMLALIVGLSPLKQILYDKQSFLYPSFTKAIEMCGKAAVPIILSCLGAQLASISETQHSAPTIRKPVTAAVMIRMVLTPFLVTPLVVLFVIYGAPYSILATDPVFIVMMIVLGCTPTAINLVQISQVNGIFEEEMLRMLFWSYGIVCVPVVTLTVFLALNVVDRLL
ncbi:dynein light chain 1, cytoplasmic [Halteromyces radiatus]|uniref:dynein light chain 1, cytoplasmic n=1 Tax=Halteromyces radiatus TaxID=101107 RepID=UPI00221F8D6A|nr:dynein light chain 1, cytoplasmic [Halteromyces radiatus]KAI8099868.1 dynein light chain 1, cytoplasmic [Halteromyces radiatus]